ncbi:MAG: repair protein SbcC/Rad50 [Acidobacteriota bacterium]|jgi:exonuclease SbcC|nr:repair protein SbcC/Rad50 [Acidobacteriota bacterium]
MHVTRVELDNIKSYERAEFNFQRGITAITGENGAGKTTILEAIAWSLFDMLDYKKEDFLRRGAKKGSVRVTFESDIDERRYTVYRDTGQGYYVYDEGLGIRLAEKKTDVSATLRKLLGTEPGTDMEALFRSAIGVPQGTFTADFLRPATQRKAAFDRLLKVEEYRDGAERLRDTVNLIHERTAEIKGRIAGAESQLARYDELVEEHRAVAARAAELTTALGSLQQEIQLREKNVRAMDDALRLMDEARSLRDRREVEHEAAANRLPALRSERDAAQAAMERKLATEADYNAHLAADNLLRKLDTERAARDRLRAEASGIESLLASARNDAQRLAEAVERAVAARASLAALEADIGTQAELERERERLRELRAQAQSERSRLARLDAELDGLRKLHTQTKERLREAEKGEGAQDRAARLESERLEVETTLSKVEKAATSYKHLSNQRKEATREVERLRREIVVHEKEAGALEKFSVKAAEAVSLTARESELTEQLARLRAQIEHDAKFHREVKNGLCPILSERCLNIGENQTLEDYFTDQLATNSAQLTTMEKERAGLNVAVREARDAEKHLGRLESARRQLAAERQLLTEREAALANLDREIAGLTHASRERLNELKATLSGIDGSLITEREASLRYAELKPLEQRLSEIEQEGKRKRDERASVAAVADALPELEKDMQEVEQRLTALGDPRGRAHALRQEAASEEQRKGELAGAIASQRALENQAQEIIGKLAQYSSLDSQWEEARRERDRTVSAHREYLESHALAASLPLRQAELEKAEDAIARAAREVAAAREGYDKASRAYSREQHDVERAALVEASKLEAATRAMLEETRKGEASLSAEIARLQEVRAAMREQFRERERLEELDETTEFIRDTLKAAGPLVTESYLYNISLEANQLFREITGEAGRALRWSRDYEIMLEEEGHERSFPNLSGGEQMAAALSIRLALLTQLSDIRLAFFDEPTTNMDAERRERLAQQIGQVQHFDQLFIISHDDTFEENVDHIIHVKRKDEGGGMRDETMEMSN